MLLAIIFIYPLHLGVRQFLHRMVVCLDDEILPFVPIAVESLMKNADAKELHDFIPLINQLVCKFKVSSFFSARFPTSRKIRENFPPGN